MYPKFGIGVAIYTARHSTLREREGVDDCSTESTLHEREKESTTAAVREYSARERRERESTTA